MKLLLNNLKIKANYALVCLAFFGVFFFVYISDEHKVVFIVKGDHMHKFDAFMENNSEIFNGLTVSKLSIKNFEHEINDIDDYDEVIYEMKSNRFHFNRAEKFYLAIGWINAWGIERGMYSHSQNDIAMFSNSLPTTMPVYGVVDYIEGYPNPWQVEGSKRIREK